MNILFENKLVLFLLAYYVAYGAWMLVSKMTKKSIRIGMKGLIVFLVFPVFYFGQPFLYYQCWMLLVMAVTGLKLF